MTKSPVNYKFLCFFFYWEVNMQLIVNVNTQCVHGWQLYFVKDTLGICNYRFLTGIQNVSITTKEQTDYPG